MKIYNLTAPVIAVFVLLFLASSSAASTPEEVATPESSTSTSTTSSTTSTTAAPTTTSTTTTTRPTGQPRPEWLGTTDIPFRRGETNVIASSTPPELVDRRLYTPDSLLPPEDDVFVSFMATPPPLEVAVRTTWELGCPVPLSDLTYAQVSFFGFDGLYHTGEFILHKDHAPGVVDIFEQLHAMKFPIEEMRVTSRDDLNAIPTGDTNNTSTFTCRRAVNSGTWSRHAYGGAIDINPFHNPYVKGDLVIPALAEAYLDRERDVPGMVVPEIQQMFAEIGWSWGGNWNSSLDWMHFSDNGN